MNQKQLLDKLDRAWTDFLESFAGLTPEQMQTPGVTEGWSVKDLLAHVTTWEAEALKYLPVIQQGQPESSYTVQYGGVDGFNAHMARQNQDLPLETVLSQLEATHARLREFVATAPEELYATETRFRQRLRDDSYSHYPEHTRAIQAWRSQQGE